MPWIVDGDNVLGTWPGRTRSDAAKRLLVREIVQLERRGRRRIVVVFDGTSPPGVSYGTDVHFSGPGRKADTLILERLRKEADPAGWTVVTGDRALGDQCRWVGAKVETPATLRKLLESEQGGEKPEAADDVDYWLKQFGEDDS
jgi:predicted RNA-binding protein with PIN domain